MVNVFAIIQMYIFSHARTRCQNIEYGGKHIYIFDASGTQKKHDTMPFCIQEMLIVVHIFINMIRYVPKKKRGKQIQKNYYLVTSIFPI